MKNFDLNHYSEASKIEGFCMLHTGGSEGKTTSIYSYPTRTFSQLPGHNNGHTVQIGYMAYPNPKLKNSIPAARFYEFADSTVHHHKNNSKIAPSKSEYQTTGKLDQSVAKAEYIQKIKQVKELLSAGEIYQMNYAIRFRKKFSGNPYHLFLRLIESNPTNFSAFLNCGDFQILSNSPERLFKVEKNVIITQPIKGTAPKSAKNALQKLLASQKERAELDMITDLERNDVGKLCKYGTLRLTKEREVMELSNLYHTYSEVRGNLRSGITRTEIVEAMFPGGSITGCPKIRAMEYIEKLEGMPRNIFTGSIFRMTDDIIDSNICIRTALIKDGYIEYWAGGGIVADSDPEAEYAECLLKAEKFLSLL